MAFTLANVTIQDLKFTEKQAGQLVDITYKNDGTAGAETVEVNPTTHNITVHMQSGTSTATQIKTAVEASYEASLLVTVTVPGTGSTAQKSCVSAPLAGGAAAVKATKSIFGLTLTALTAGTDGNDIRIKFVDDTDDVTVSTNDITVDFEDGATAAHVAALINADAEANLLVVATGSPLDILRTDMAADFVSLADGAAAATPSVIVQDLTFSSDTAGTAGNGATVSYTTGATAGAEVVSLSGSDITIQIQSGTSTATQIETAFNASDAVNGAKATNTVTVLDYAAGNLTAASGTVTVEDYSLASAVAASGTVEVVDYTALTEETAVASGDIAFGTPDAGSTVIVTGPAGGPYTFTKVAADPEEDEFSDIDELRLLITQIDGLDAVVNGTDIELTVEDAGTGPNAWTITGTSSYSGLSVTFSGGQNHAVLTVNGTALTEGTDWDAETDNDTTAANLEVAIEAVTNINSSATNAVITVSAAATGTAGNAYTLATSDAVNLDISGALLTGGRAATTVTVNGVALVANVDWTAETDNDTTAANLEVAIEAVTGINSSATNAVITVTAATPGTAGNSITLATSNTDAVTVGAATLSGGIAALVITVDGTALTEGTDFNAETNNNTTATNIATAIDALAGVTAAAVGPLITITNDARGTVGNAKTLTTSNALVASVGGATFSGGTDAYAVTVSGTGATAQATVNAIPTASGVGEGARAYSNSQAGTALTSSFVSFLWNFPSKYFRLVNDETAGTDTIAYSFDGGTSTHGTLTFGEELLLNENVPLHGIHLKYVNAAPNYRISVLG